MEGRQPACILCRGVKVKCVNNNDQTQPCQRCHRLNLPCAYSKKRRRVKAGAAAAAAAAVAAEQAAARAPSPPADHHRALQHPPPPLHGAPPMVGGPSSAPFAHHHDHLSPNGQWRVLALPANGAGHSHPPPQPHPYSSNSADASSGFNPGGSVVGAPAPRDMPIGAATPQSLTQTVPPPEPAPEPPADTWHDLAITTGAEHSLSTSSGYQRRNFLDDPIVMGFLTEHEAARMIELYHQYLNPMIALLDSYLHSFPYLRERTPLLLSAVLAVTAKFFHKEMYPRLASHAQRLVSRCVEHGACTTAIVQALLILVYWKEPRDVSAWIKIGLAIRMGYQLGWHTGTTSNDEVDPNNEIALREKLDRERTWYTFDKTYASTFNLPNTIRSHEFGDMEQWVNEHSHLDINNDLRLCCSLENLVLFDGVRQWRTECRTISQRHALLQIERYFERALQLNNKWCLAGPGLPRGMGERQKSFMTFVMSHVIFLLRFAMIHFVPPGQVELVLSECVDRAHTYVENLRNVVEDGSWGFQQDIASAKTASFVVTVQELYYRVSGPQRQIVHDILCEMHRLYSMVAKDQAQSPTAFVARFLDKILRNIDEASLTLSQAQGGQLTPQAAAVPGSAPVSFGPGSAATTVAASTGSATTLPLRSPTPETRAVVPPSESSGPVDHLAFGDLTEFLGMTGMALGDSGSADEQSYWSGLVATMPLSLNDFM